MRREWRHTPKHLILSTGKKNPDVWWYADKNHIAIWTPNGCIGRIYPRSLKRFLKEIKEEGR